jgi:hypothetical protein
MSVSRLGEVEKCSMGLGTCRDEASMCDAGPRSQVHEGAQWATTEAMMVWFRGQMGHNILNNRSQVLPHFLCLSYDSCTQRTTSTRLDYFCMHRFVRCCAQLAAQRLQTTLVIVQYVGSLGDEVCHQALNCPDWAYDDGDCMPKNAPAPDEQVCANESFYWIYACCS